MSFFIFFIIFRICFANFSFFAECEWFSFFSHFKFLTHSLESPPPLHCIINICKIIFYITFVEPFRVKVNKIEIYKYRLILFKLHPVVEEREFMQNYEFPKVGTWDRFNFYVSSKLKSCFPFEKQML